MKMKKRYAASGAALTGALAVGVTACGSSGSTNAASTSTTQNTKAAFCAANVTLDKAGVTVNSPEGFLAVLKSHTTTLDTLKKDAPSGKVGSEARALVSAAQSAVASNSTKSLEQVPGNYGGDVDTYCGVDGSGDPLPSYFGTGKGTALCSVQGQISAGTNNVQGPSDILAFLKAHPSLVSQFGADLGSLPASLKSEGQTLFTTAQQAIASNNAALLGTQAIGRDAMDVGLYCGENQ